MWELNLYFYPSAGGFKKKKQKKSAGTERVECSPTRQTLLAPSAKRRGVLGESHEGQAASYQY